ncbi:hypothetical protein U1Q18_044383 [Sarracenia purpurea var. burkii]
MTAFADSFPVTPFLVFCFVIGFIQIQAAARGLMLVSFLGRGVCLSHSQWTGCLCFVGAGSILWSRSFLDMDFSFETKGWIHVLCIFVKEFWAKGVLMMLQKFCPCFS